MRLVSSEIIVDGRFRDPSTTLHENSVQRKSGGGEESTPQGGYCHAKTPFGTIKDKAAGFRHSLGMTLSGAVFSVRYGDTPYGVLSARHHSKN